MTDEDSMRTVWDYLASKKRPVSHVEGDTFQIRRPTWVARGNSKVPTLIGQISAVPGGSVVNVRIGAPRILLVGRVLWLAATSVGAAAWIFFAFVVFPDDPASSAPIVGIGCLTAALGWGVVGLQVRLNRRTEARLQRFFERKVIRGADAALSAPALERGRG